MNWFKKANLNKEDLANKIISVSRYWHDDQPLVALKWFNNQEPDVDELIDLKNTIDNQLWDDVERNSLSKYGPDKFEYQEIPLSDRAIMDEIVNALSGIIDELV
jgi:hypothetical protein